MRWAKLLIVSLVVLGACGGGDDSPEAEPTDDTVVGIVTSVESEGLNEVTSFTVKDGDEIVEILIDPEVNYGFPLGHVEEHRKTSAPVEVPVEERDGKLYAQEILDAGEAPTPDPVES